MITITIEQAIQFILYKQGLLGEYRFVGKEGALDYIKQAGCIQFDPVDLCGKMAELTLQSRVKNFKKSQLADLLYHDRQLFDYPDKQLSIIPIIYWPYFKRYRDVAATGEKQFSELMLLKEQVFTYIREHGPVSSETLPLEGTIRWHSNIHWSGDWHGESKIARAILEQLYSTGELIVHHKEGSRKYYDLAINHLPQDVLAAPDPLPDDFEHQKWRVFRRIGAIGLLYDRPSGFWNNVWQLDSDSRHQVFHDLVEEGFLRSLMIEGLKDKFYYLSADEPLLTQVLTNPVWKKRCEFIAPLDPFLWDKQFIRTLFAFDYSWEIYTPDIKRKYVAYVLPIIYGNRFIGRIEALNDRKTKTLVVKNIWYEEDVKPTKALLSALNKRIKQFSHFNECEQIIFVKPITNI